MYSSDSVHFLSQVIPRTPFEGGHSDLNQSYEFKSNCYYNKNLKELARKLRKDSTKAEIRLWQELLQNKQMYGYAFLRQRPVMNFIADFMCKELMLIIEVDGYTHHFQEQLGN